MSNYNRRLLFKGLVGAALADLCVLPFDAVARPTDVAAPTAVPPALRKPATISSRAQGATLLAVSMAGSRVICVGERGIILISDDLGRTWRQASVPVSTTIVAVQFVDNKVGWAVGHMGTVLATVDGGLTWSLQLDGVRAAKLVAEKEAPGDPADGKATYGQQLITDGPDKPFLDLHFDDHKRGYIVGAFNLAFKTEDGGISWIPISASVENPRGLHIYSICRVRGALCAAGEQGLLLKADDQGNFKSMQSPAKASIFGVIGSRSGELILFGLRGRAYISENGIQTWRELLNEGASSINAGVELSDGRVVFGCQGGELLVKQPAGDKMNSYASLNRIPITGLCASSSDRIIASTMHGVRLL